MKVFGQIGINSENIFVCTDDGGDKDNTTYQNYQPKVNSNDEDDENKLEYYYYYKKPFKEDEKVEDIFDFK